MEYTLIRSKRKTLAVRVTPDGRVEVRSPLSMKKGDIDAFLKSREAWIEKHVSAAKARSGDAPAGKFTESELEELCSRARRLITGRVEYYAPIVGVSYGRISIRRQRTRWGSCSSAGNLNFNCLLALVPDKVMDSVVVHELCHLKEMNHSPRFYGEVRRVFPEYDKWHGWLRENGYALLRRL